MCQASFIVKRVGKVSPNMASNGHVKMKIWCKTSQHDLDIVTWYHIA